MENEEGANKKNINDLWLNNVFQILIRLEDYQRLAKEGCVSIQEYLMANMQNPNLELNMPHIQKKNFNMFLVEFEIFLSNTKHLIDKETFDKMKNKFSSLIDYEYQVGGYIKVISDTIQNKRRFEMKKEFYTALMQMSELRGMAVNSLWNILSPNARENFEGMPK